MLVIDSVIGSVSYRQYGEGRKYTIKRVREVGEIGYSSTWQNKKICLFTPSHCILSYKNLPGQHGLVNSLSSVTGWGRRWRGWE